MIPSCEGAYASRVYRQKCQKKIENSSAVLTFGALLCKIGKYTVAQRYFEKLRDNPNNENISDIYHYLGWSYHGQGDCEQAIANFERAHDLIGESDGISRACVLKSIGKILVQRNFLEESLDYYTSALDLLVASRGAEHEELVIDYQNLARLHNLIGNYPLAREYFQKSLQINPNKTNLTSYLHPAQARRKTGHSRNCSKGSSHSIDESFQSSQYHSVSSSLFELGSIEYKMGESASALENMERSLRIDQYLCNSTTSEFLKNFNSLGNVSPTIDLENKEVNYQLCRLQSVERRSSKTEIERAEVHEDVACAYQKTGQFDFALEHFQLALEQREHLGRKLRYSVDIARVQNSLADTYRSLDQCKRAIATYKKALTIYEKFLPDADQDCIEIREKINQLSLRNSCSILTTDQDTMIPAYADIEHSSVEDYF